MLLPRYVRRVIVIIITVVMLLTLTTAAFAASPGNTSTPSEWARADVNEANSLGLVPNNLRSSYQRSITRAEFCSLAVALYEKAQGTITSRAPAFSDSSDVNVLKMASLGIVNGVGNNRFDPSGELTREQAAAILVRLSGALEKPLRVSTATFTDRAQISNWALVDVGKIQASGIMSGVGGDRFDPKGFYTREQSIVTILRIWNLVKPEESGTFVFPYKFSATDLYGNKVTEQSLGEKEVFFVHFWATWCGPCINEMPEIAKVVEKYGDRVGFIALLDDYSTATAAAIRITESSGVSFTMVDARLPDFKTLLGMVQSGYVPTSIIIDSDGKVIGGQIIGAYGGGYGDFIDAALDR